MTLTDQSTAPDLLIRGAELLVAMDDHDTEISHGWIAVKDGRIQAMGGPGTEPSDAKKVLDAKGGLITPGLINTHHHMFQNLTRSNPDSLKGDFFDWLRVLYPMFARLDEDAVYLSSWVGMAELALGGCTTTTDHMYAHPRPRLLDATIAASRDFGMRFHPVRGSMNLSVEDGGLPPVSVVQDQATILEDSERLIREYHDPSPGAMVRVALGPCAPFTVTPELMKATAEMAERADVRLHTHLAEDVLDDEFCLETYGRRPIEHFDAVGWGTNRAWVAHCIYPNEQEIHSLARWGVSVAHCPSALMVLGGDHLNITPVRPMLDAGVNVSIGVDGSSSADTASMWLETRNAMMLSRLREGRATAMAARQALRMATRGGAISLGRAGEIGQLTVGAAADIVVWPTNELQFAGAIADPVTALLHCGPANARHTVINGEIVVESGRPVSSDLKDNLALHRQAAARVQGLSG